jgi:hypothetical protein
MPMTTIIVILDASHACSEAVVGKKRTGLWLEFIFITISVTRPFGALHIVQ